MSFIYRNYEIKTTNLVVMFFFSERKSIENTWEVEFRGGNEHYI